MFNKSSIINTNAKGKLVMSFDKIPNFVKAILFQHFPALYFSLFGFYKPYFDAWKML